MEYFIKKGYKPNLKNVYYDDAPDDGVIWQPDVYDYAIKFALDNNIDSIIDIGSGNGDKLYKYRNDFNITFVDFGDNLELIKDKFSNSDKKHNYIDNNFEEGSPNIKNNVAEKSIVICSDVIEHLRKPDFLAKLLTDLSKKSKLVFISTPDRFRFYGYDHNGMPDNKCHVREWRCHELYDYFKSIGMDCRLSLTRTNDCANQRATILLISGTFIQTDSNINNDVYKKSILTVESLKSYSNINTIPDVIKNSIGFVDFSFDNFFVYHFKKAIGDNKKIRINKFRFINKEVEGDYLNSGIENTDRLLIQFIGETICGEGEEIYPITFNVIEGYSEHANTNERLITLPFEYLKMHYFIESILGFKNIDVKRETLAKIGDFEALMNQFKSLNSELDRLSDTIKSQKIKELELEEEIKYLYKNPFKYLYNLLIKIKNKIKYLIWKK